MEQKQHPQHGPRSPRSVAFFPDESSSEEQLQKQGGNSILFPWKLHEMLRNCVKENKESVVSWLPDGKAFKVHNIPEFVHEILPLYFKQTKYKSFQRQLNLWGFERFTSGSDKGAYYHVQFLRDHPDLCKHLKRQRAKKGRSSSTASESSSSSPDSPTPSMPSLKSTKSKATKTATSRNASALSIRPVGVPSITLITRQVSESSLESFGDLLREFDMATESPLDLAEFEGFTFHLLEEERYEELDLEFKFSEQQQKQHAKSALTSAPTSAPLEHSIQTQPFLSQKEEESHVHTLLQELEQGTFGTPKTSFDAVVGEDLPLCPI